MYRQLRENCVMKDEIRDIPWDFQVSIIAIVHGYYVSIYGYVSNNSNHGCHTCMHVHATLTYCSYKRDQIILTVTACITD